MCTVLTWYVYPNSLYIFISIVIFAVRCYLFIGSSLGKARLRSDEKCCNSATFRVRYQKQMLDDASNAAFLYVSHTRRATTAWFFIAVLRHRLSRHRLSRHIPSPDVFLSSSSIRISFPFSMEIVNINLFSDHTLMPHSPNNSLNLLNFNSFVQ